MKKLAFILGTIACLFASPLRAEYSYTNTPIPGGTIGTGTQGVLGNVAALELAVEFLGASWNTDERCEVEFGASLCVQLGRSPDWCDINYNCSVNYYGGSMGTDSDSVHFSDCLTRSGEVISYWFQDKLELPNKTCYTKYRSGIQYYYWASFEGNAWMNAFSRNADYEGYGLIYCSMGTDQSQSPWYLGIGL